MVTKHVKIKAVLAQKSGRETPGKFIDDLFIHILRINLFKDLHFIGFQGFCVGTPVLGQPHPNGLGGIIHYM